MTSKPVCWELNNEWKSMHTWGAEKWRGGTIRVFKTQPYMLNSLAQWQWEKLAAPFYGPLTITERTGKVEYRLELTPSSQIHPVFHVSQLKKAVKSHPISPTIPSQLITDLVLEVQPAAVLGVRNANTGNHTTEVLIEWYIGRILIKSMGFFWSFSLRTRWLFGSGIMQGIHMGQRHCRHIKGQNGKRTSSWEKKWE